MANESTLAVAPVAALISGHLRELIEMADRAGPDFDLLSHLITGALAEAQRIERADAETAAESMDAASAALAR